MGSRSAAVLLLVAGLALAGWLGLAWNRARHVLPRELQSPESSALPVPAEPSRTPLLTTPSATEAGTAPAAPLREEPLGALELTETLRVVFDDDGRPAGRVDVYWFGSGELGGTRWRDELDELGMGQDFFQRNGRHFVTDDAGHAQVPADTEAVQVVGTTPTHFGMNSLARTSANGEGIELRLREAFAVEVRVLDALSRSPLRDVVVVGACARLPGSKVGARSDADGIARLFPLFHEEDPSCTWYASPPGVFFEDIRVALPTGAVEQPLELLLPRSARASLRLVDAQGRICPFSGKLLIGWNDREGDPVQPRYVRIINGAANLTRIEAGLDLHVRAELKGLDEEPAAVFHAEAGRTAPTVFDLRVETKLEPARD